MAGRNYRASIIIDLLGNIAQRSRQYAGNISAMARSSQGALRGLQSTVASVSGSIDRLGTKATGAFKGMAAGALGLTGAGFTAKKFFIDIASTRENQRIALNSLYKGDKAHAQKMMDWAIQNAQDSTWGLTGVMQEFTSSKAFGMSDNQTKDFITMLEDQGALKGWDLNTAQGASLQLKQMFARQQITAADANLLTGYGINVYQTLADRLGKSQKEVRDQGEKGKLGPKSIQMLFKALSDEAKGAQANAMNSWTGLTAQMGDVWEGFADKLMNKGPFERLKNSLRGVLAWYDRVSTPNTQGISELDRITDRLAVRFNATFDAIQSGARKAWAALKVGWKALAWVDDNIVSLKALAKVIGSVWLANKALRMGAAVMRPTWKVVTSPYRGYQWWRNRRRGAGGAPGLPGVIPSPQLVQHVFVVNWPAGGMAAGGDGYAGEGRRKRGPGRGSRRRVPVAKSPALPATPPKKAGLFSRLFRGAGNLITGGAGAVGRVASRGWQVVTGAGKKASAWAGPVGKWLSAKGSKALGYLGRAGGSVARFAGGRVLNAAMLAPTLLSDEVSTHDKGAALGSTAGMWAGGAIGSLAGPIGTVAGSALGTVVGEYLGGFVADLYGKWDSKDQAPPPPPQEQKIAADARIRLELPDGLRVTSTTVNESGLGLNLYTGPNFIPGF